MAKKAIPLFEPGRAPIRGMNSSLAPASLEEGYFSQLTNIRFGTRQAQIRPGITQLTSSAPTTGASLRGAWSGTINGALTIVAAYRVGSYTEVYNLNPTTFAWTEITAPGTNSSIGNKYGNTRFPTDGQVTFAVIRDINGNECLVMQNSADLPRVYDPNGAAFAQTAIHQTVNPPTSTTQQRVYLDFPYRVALWENGTRSSTTYQNSNGLAVTAATNASPIQITTSAAHGLSTGETVGIFGVVGNTAANGVWTVTVVNSTEFTLNGSTGNGTYVSGYGSMVSAFGFSDSGSGQSLSPTLLIGTNAASGQTAVIDFASSSGVLRLDLARQFIMIVTNSYLPLFYNLKIEAGTTGGSYVTIYDPTQPQYSPNYVTGVDPNNANTVCVSFSLDGLDPSGAVFPNCETLRFTWVGSQPPSTGVQVLMLLMAASGQVQGGSSYGIAWTNSGSRAESYGLVLPYPTTAPIQTQGGNPTNGLLIPNDESLFYSATVYYQDVTTAEMDRGTDTLSIYRMDPGDTDYWLVASTVVNTFNTGTNSWTGSTGSILTYADTTPSSGKNYSIDLPSSYQVCIPIGSCMLTDNQRLYVGGSGTCQNEIWISEFQFHVRFSPEVNFINPSQVDPTSAVMDTIPGEIVTGFGRVPGYLIGVDPITVFTNASVYRLDGIDATSLSRPTYLGPHGCPYPRTIAQHGGMLYWVDCENQLQVFGGGEMRQVSRFKVDNILASANLTKATGAWLNDRYYLGYQPSGQTVNTSALVFEELYNEFCQDLFAAGDCGQLVTINSTGGRLVYMFSSVGQVYQLESASTTDAGTAIPVTITTREIHNEMWGRIDAGRVGIVCDPGSETLTISRTWKPASVGVSGTINLSNMPSGETTAYLWEHLSTDEAPGGSGISVIVSITGNMVGGTNIYSLVMELGESSEGRASNG